MGKHLKSFKTQAEFEAAKGELTIPWVVYILDKNDGTQTSEEDVKYRVLKVADCIEQSYFFTNGTSVTPVEEIPYSIEYIYDFERIFFGNKDFEGNTTNSPYVFVCGNNSYLTQEQKEQIIDILNRTDLHRSLGQINLQYYNLPNKDIVITRFGQDDYYTYDSHADLMSGSTFNKVTLINKRGNISSMNSLFRRANMKTLEFIKDGGSFTPTDMAGVTEFCYDLASFPNTIDYQNCTNIGWAWECCYALPEVPNYHTVVTEEDRLTMPENTVGYNYGISVADQMCNHCTNLQKIGPVLNCKKLNPSGPNGTLTMPTLMFNNCHKLSDVRLKNLSNGNWNLSTIYNLDVDSIKYAIENVTYQPTENWANVAPTTVNNAEVAFNPNSKVLMFLCPMETTHLRDYYAPKATKFKVKVPTGCILKINAYNTYYKYLNEQLVITGDGSEKELQFANTSAVYSYITLEKTDGSAIIPQDTVGLDISIMYYDSSKSAYTINQVPSCNHTLSFSGRHVDKVSDKTIIPAETIQSANDKGWRIYTDGIEITPTGDKLTANYRFKFTDWEINPNYTNDVEVTDTTVTIKKFRPNMWIMRSAANMNNGELSTAFKNIYLQIKGVNQYVNDIFSYRFYSNGCVGGDGGTKGSIRGFAILPFSLHSTPTTYVAPELPFSSYVWDGPGNETSAWRGDWGCGYNGYGFVNDPGKKLVYPNQSSFPTPYESHRLALGLYTGNVHTFDRWFADGGPRPYLTKIDAFTATISQRVASTSTAKALGTQEVFENVKFRFTNMQPGDSIKWSHTTSKIVDEAGNTITEITADGVYKVSNTGLDGGFVLCGDTSLTGTNPIKVEILDNPEYVDSEGYIDISQSPIVIDLLYDSIT